MFSVIIPAKNEAGNIKRCIRSVFNSVDSNVGVEVIVVDNGSTDETVEIAKSEGAIVFIEKQANVSGLRNLGASKASYNILGFIDADCEALPGWLENANEILMNPKIGLTGDFCLVPSGHGWIEESLYANIERRKREVAYLGSANMVTRKNVFSRIGGFDTEVLSGEDYILCLKLKQAGFKVIADPEVAVVHYGYPKMLRHVFKREIWHGMGMIDLYKNGKLTLPLIWAFLNIILISILLVTVFTQQYGVSILLLSMLFLLPAGAALKRCCVCSNYKNFFQLYIIFVVYGYARTISFVKLVLGVAVPGRP